MSKNDYTNQTITTRYKSLVVKPGSTPTKVTVSNDEKRTRAEMLDMVEELLATEGTDGVGVRRANMENFRALLHILIKSINNDLDDVVSLDATTVTSSMPTSSKSLSAGTLYNDKGIVKIKL